MRVPLLARWPGVIPANRTTGAMASALDILPTLARLGSAPLPEAPLDGVDTLPLLQPELYNLDADPGEDYELSRDHPDQVEDLRSKMEDAVQTFPAEVQNAWYQTMARKVAPTPVGALPVAQPA